MNSPQMVESLSEIVRIPSKSGEPKEGAPYGEASRQALKFAMDLGRKLDQALMVENQKEMLLIRVNTLENEMRKLKEQMVTTS